MPMIRAGFEWWGEGEKKGSEKKSIKMEMGAWVDECDEGIDGHKMCKGIKAR